MKAINILIIAFVMLLGINAQAQTTDDVQKSAYISRAASGTTEIENPLALNIYPNPASTQVTISLQKKEEMELITIIVTDVAGKVMHMREVKGTGLYKGDIDISAYPVGAYVVNVKTGNEKIVRTINKF